MWRKRIALATKRQLEKEKVIGKDIKRFIQKNKKSRCSRSNGMRISLCKAVPSIRSSDSDRTVSSVHDKRSHRAIRFNKEDMQRLIQKKKKSRCRSNGMWISLNKAVPLLRSVDIDEKMQSVIGKKFDVNNSSQPPKVNLENNKAIRHKRSRLDSPASKLKESFFMRNQSMQCKYFLF